MQFDQGLVSGSTTLLILSLLADGDKYGFELITEMERRSDSQLSLKEGTLYPLLHGLESKGLVVSYEGQAGRGRRRRYYQLTSRGRAELAAKKQEWTAFSTVVSRVVGSEGSGLA